MSSSQLKQPRGFSIFCATEMWERYGFYIVQYSLALFLTSRLNLSDVKTYEIVGSFTALVYICPIIGGYLADKILGYRHTVVLGCVSLACGYALLSLASNAAMLYWALAIIAMGTGIVKPNISGLLGDQYRLNDPRRHKGFSIFYTVLNVGEVLAALSSGYLSMIITWNEVYITAATGLVIGSATFFIGLRFFDITDTRPRLNKKYHLALAYASCAGLVVFNKIVLGNQTLSWIMFGAVIVAAILIVIVQASKSDSHEIKGIAAFFILAAISIVFWALFFLLYSSLNLYILRAVDHHFVGMYFPTTVYGGIEAFGVVLLGPVLAWMWLKLREHNLDFSVAGKFTLGLALMGLTMLILYLATAYTSSGKVSTGWLILAYFVLAAGELSLSAIGLAMVTEYVPQRMVGLMLGIWFICTGLGGKLSGLFAEFAAMPHNLHRLPEIKIVYEHAFWQYALIAFSFTLLSLLLAPYIKKLTADYKSHDHERAMWAKANN